MATPDLPAEAVEAAERAAWTRMIVDGSPSYGFDIRAALAAAAPYLRAQVLAEVDAALRELDLNDLEMRFIHERLGK